MISLSNENLKHVKLSRYRHIGAKRDRKCNSYSFLTSAVDGGEWSASRPDRALRRVRTGQEAGWASELVRTQRLEKKSLPLLGIEPRSPARPVCSRHHTE
jgi:hypothetical protein